jgi:diadenosine tetraphosphate (Ap4A) HIT family hydrolase
LTDCWVCEMTAANGVPGGTIHETVHWIVDHCVGPLGIGTLIVRPRRHVVHVADLDAEEAVELGPLLQQTTAVVTELVQPDQVYVTLWSHAGGEPGHIHFVVQPVPSAQMEKSERYGPYLQVEMFDAGVSPDPGAMAEFAERARAAWPAT